MRLVAVFAVLAVTALPAAAQPVDKEGCLKSVEIVMAGVNARAEGKSKAATRRMLQDALDRNAGEQLAEFIWSLPEDQLTDAVGEAWKAQCEAS